MSRHGKGGWRGVLATVSCVVASYATGSCAESGPARGGLMLVVSSDSTLPLGRLEVQVSDDKGKTLLSNKWRVPAEAALPTTVAIVSNGDPTAVAKISVIAWAVTSDRPDVALDRRDAIVTQIPPDRVATLTVVLSARCSSKIVFDEGTGEVGTTCTQGTTCDNNGDCSSPEVAATDLPTYHPGDENAPGASMSDGGEGGAGEGGAPGLTPSACADACQSPPSDDCLSGAEFLSYDRIGSCVKGECSYVSHRTACNCRDHACTTDICAEIDCSQPPAAACTGADGRTKTSYAPSGTCDGAGCQYTPTHVACDFGCRNGACKPDPCVGKSCDTPPANDCTGGEFLTYDKVGSCEGDDAHCRYVSHQTACACQDHACPTDFCPPCNQPPVDACGPDGKTLTTYAATGTCSGSSCSYAATNTICPFGCAGGACQPDPCSSVICGQPPPAFCADGSTLTSYGASGTCKDGQCTYPSTNMSCAFGCAGGSCKANPCANVTCNSPPAPSCKNATTVTTYASPGKCTGGPPCQYSSTDVSCGTNQACSGAGMCSLCKTDASCGPSCTACAGATPKCKDLGTSSQCVGCLADNDCSAGVKCNTTTNTCVTPPSCLGLAPTCGPNANGDCCASSLVSGISSPTFFRSYDGSATYGNKSYPAQVSDFRLDNYEITVGRFRKFVKAYTQTMIPSGAGKNPNNPSDPGWDSAWNSSLDANATALTVALRCGLQTWQDVEGSAAVETRPINCLNWFEAQAFCIWDGGRLPTEAEWNYAAAGGTQQRPFPWGTTVPGADANLAVYGCYYPTPMMNCSVASIAPVGSIAAGIGRYGQYDLAGNMWEWVQDWWLEYSTAPCLNCANLTPGTVRVQRGGNVNYGLPYLYTSVRSYAYPTGNGFGTGARCARAPASL